MRVVLQRDLASDDRTRKKLREVLDRMSAAKPGQTLADVIAGEYSRARAAAGKAAFESMFQHGDFSPKQGRLYEKPKLETAALRERILKVLPEDQQVYRVKLWAEAVDLYPQMNNEDRRDLFEQAIEELIAAGQLDESSDMKYSRPQPKERQSGLEFFS